MHADWDADKQAGNTVLCFDLENVVNLPKAEIGPLFYKRKLNLNNMTGHYSQNKQGYCVIWTDVIAGRAGDDIASSVTAIVEMLIKDNPNIVNLVTWSESCVPQNRNQMICYSMLDVIRKNQQLKSITLKYSIPGHSSVQEVDNMNSKIERAMNVAEFFSLVSLLSILVKCHRQKFYKVILLQERHFKEFSQASSSFEYSAVSFSKVVSLRLTREHDKVFYKTSRLQKNL